MTEPQACRYCAAPLRAESVTCVGCGRCQPPPPHLTLLSTHEPAQWKDALCCVITGFAIFGMLVSIIALLSTVTSGDATGTALAFLALLGCVGITFVAIRTSERYAPTTRDFTEKDRARFDAALQAALLETHDSEIPDK